MENATGEPGGAERNLLRLGGGAEPRYQEVPHRKGPFNRDCLQLAVATASASVSSLILFDRRERLKARSTMRPNIILPIWMQFSTVFSV